MKNIIILELEPIKTKEEKYKPLIVIPTNSKNLQDKLLITENCNILLKKIY